MGVINFRRSGAAILLLAAASVASAGPLERNAASKATGDMQGRTIERRVNRTNNAVNSNNSNNNGNSANAGAQPGAAAQATLTAPTPPAPPGATGTQFNAQINERQNTANVQGQAGSTRSFSYQGTQNNDGSNANRRARQVPGFFRADRKALNDY